MFTLLVRGSTLDVRIVTSKVDPRAVRVSYRNITYKVNLSILCPVSGVCVIVNTSAKGGYVF